MIYVLLKDICIFHIFFTINDIFLVYCYSFLNNYLLIYIANMTIQSRDKIRNKFLSILYISSNCKGKLIKSLLFLIN